MKSKKSIMKLAVCFLLAVACVCSVAACNKAEEKGDLFPEYKPVVITKEDYKDDYVTLDGKLDEDIWENSVWHSMQSVRENRNENNNVTVLEDANIDAVAVVKEKGIYLGVKSNDKVIYVGEDWGTNSSPDVKNTAFGKTGVTIYMTDARNRYRSGKFSYEIGFAADGMVTLGYSDDGNGYTRNASGKIRAATVCNGGVNTADANGYSVEAFIPWEALAGVDASDAPESIVATFGSHRYNNATPKEAALVWELLDQRYNQGWMQTAAWVEYGASGVREQPEGNVFGTYGEFGYDAAFDVTGDVDGADRAITFTPDPTARRQSRIYVHDIKGTEIYAEAKFTIGDVSTYVDQWPMLGLSFHGDPATVDGETKTCVLHTGITLDLKANNKFNSTYTAPALNGEDFTGKRQFNTNNPFDPTTEDGFKISVYRKGETFYIFYNDKLYDIKSFPYIQADTQTFIGLYVLNLPVTVTDYVFYAGEDAATHVPENVKNYIPTDYEIDGVADAKWNEYTGAVAALKTTDASGKTFTAKAILGSNGLYFIAEAKHQYYFDDNVPNGEWANQFSTPGVAGVTNIAVAIGNDNSPRLHFTVSKYGVYACGGGTGANVIGTMKTTDSGVEGSKTRYTSVAECFVPMPVLEANGGYTDANKDGANIQLVFVSYSDTEKDNLETAGNYYSANETDWKWTWPLAIPANNELNSFARNHYMKVTANGIEKQPAVTTLVNGSATDTSATVTIDNTGDYIWGKTYNFTVALKDCMLFGVYINGSAATESGGGYSFVYNGATEIQISTSVPGVTQGNVEVTVNGKDGINLNGATLMFTPNNGGNSVTGVVTNGKVTLSNVPVGVYSVSGKVLGGTLNFNTIVTVRAAQNACTVAASNLVKGDSNKDVPTLNAETSSITFVDGKTTSIALQRQNISGETWLTFRVKMPSDLFTNTSYPAIDIYVFDDSGNYYIMQLLVHGGVGKLDIKGGYGWNDQKDAVLSQEEQAALTGDGLYVALQCKDGKADLYVATTSAGLKSSTSKYQKNFGTSVTQIRIDSAAVFGSTSSLQYISSGATLDAAIAEMNGYAAKDAPAAQ